MLLFKSDLMYNQIAYVIDNMFRVVYIIENEDYLLHIKFSFPPNSHYPLQDSYEAIRHQTTDI